MTARRTLTPAARGVVLAVRAALRAGRVDLADQADGSTLATSTAPDGTVLLRAVLRLPVPGAADPRQLTLPAVAPVPQPAEAPPAPVAVPAGEEREPEAPAPQGEPVRCWISVAQWDDLALRDEEGHGWVAEPVAGADLGWESFGTWVTAPVPAGPVLNELRKVCQRAGITLHESDTMPPPHTRQSARVNGLAPGDLIEMDGAAACVGGVDKEGFAWCTTDAKGYLTGPVERALWGEVEHVDGTWWRVRPVDTESPTQQREAAKAAKPKREKAAPKARPARLEEVPEADALARYGERSVVAQLHKGDAWGLVWSDKLPGQMTYQIAVESVLEQAHAARIYDRGKHCVRDSRDGGAK